MSRIPTPASIEKSLPAAQPLLEAVKRQLGVVPNMFRIIGNSPAGLEGYLSLLGALGKGELEPKTRTRIAMVVAELNGCDYCLSAHTYLGKNVALNTLTNYVNKALATEIDFPVVSHHAS